MKGSTLRSVAAILASLMMIDQANAAFDGEKIRSLVEMLNSFASSGCNKAQVGEINQAISLLNGSLTQIADEKVRAAHADQLREAFSGVKDPIFKVVLGTPDKDCPKKITDGVKKIMALPISKGTGASADKAD